MSSFCLSCSLLSSLSRFCSCSLSSSILLYASVNFSSMKLSTKPWISSFSGHSSSSRIRRISCTAADVDPRCSSKDDLTSNMISSGNRAALITEPATCAARVPAIAALLATAPAVAAADADIVAAEVAALKNLAPNSTLSSVDAPISS